MLRKADARWLPLPPKRERCLRGDDGTKIAPVDPTHPNSTFAWFECGQCGHLFHEEPRTEPR